MRTKKKGRFPLFLLAYVLFWVILIMAGLRYLWGAMVSYEASRPVHTIDAYAASFDDDHIHRLVDGFIGTLDHNLQSEEEAYGLIRACFDGELSYAKMSALSTEDKLVYAISLDGRKVGSVTMVKRDEKGETVWFIADEEMDFSWLLSSNSITVPSSWRVNCNGHELGEDYLTETGIPYEELEELAADGYPTPSKVSYAIDGYLGEKGFTVTDLSGNSYVTDGGVQEGDLSESLSVEKKGEAERLTGQFLELYIQFMSCSNRNPSGNYLNLRPYMVAGSKIDRRVHGAIEGLTWASSRGDVLHDVNILSIIELGEGYYLTDVTYQIDTKSAAGIYTSDAAVKIIMQDTEKGLLVENLYTY